MIGALELAGAAGLIIGLWLAWLGILAALGLVALMAGAVFFHQRVSDSPKAMAPAATLGVLALLTVVLRTASG
ncbi:MAG: DoxX family protein [Actinomycetota bacterium]|nr:DoxX family protein [Actinomycetota bacterium]